MRRCGGRGEMMKGEEKRKRENKLCATEGRDNHKRKRRCRFRLFRLCGTPPPNVSGPESDGESERERVK